MEIIVNGKEFKTVIERAATCVVKKAVFTVLESVLIKASAGKITVSATTTEKFVTIDLPGTIVEDGYAFIELNNVKKVMGMPGVVRITTKDISATFSNGKKKSQIKIAPLDISDMPECDDNNLVMVTEFNEVDLVKILGKAAVYTNMSDINSIMGAINFNIANKRIEALDGHRIIAKEFDNDIHGLNDVKSLAVPADIAGDLKKIANKNHVEIHANDKYMVFVGDDYTYAIKRFAATYYDISKFLVDINFTEVEFNVDRKELLSVSKEYKKLVKSGEYVPMVFVENNNNLKTYMSVPGYKTSDDISVKWDTEKKNVFIGLNPAYVLDAMNTFDCDEVTMQYFKKTNPVYFRDDAEKLFVMILPIHTKETKEEIKDFVA